MEEGEDRKRTRNTGGDYGYNVIKFRLLWRGDLLISLHIQVKLTGLRWQLVLIIDISIHGLNIQKLMENLVIRSDNRVRVESKFGYLKGLV